jgi:type I restriction enzyme S subunit
MRSTYKKLGPYIRELKVRNTDGGCTDLRGVSIGKAFMPSVANIHGTDLSKYKRVKRDQFAFNPMHVGRDEVLPIAMLMQDEPVIVSPAYVVFEVKDHDALLPDYLMMWCRRPEFDRNAWFTTDNSVRGGFSWDNFCDMELPVPSTQKQLEIVKEYQTVVDRIRLNERLNEKLEDAAQAIHKQWFVEFEFPMTAEYAESIGKPELAGQPYKSSGGEMEYNDVLEQEIPKGWREEAVYSVATFKNGSAYKDEDFVAKEAGLPVIKIAELKAGVTDSTSFAKPNGKRVRLEDGDLLYSWSGNPETSLEVFKWFGGPALLNQHIFRISFADGQDPVFVYCLLKQLKSQLIKIAEGKQTTGLGHVTVKDMKELFVPCPEADALTSFTQRAGVIHGQHSNVLRETQALGKLADVLLRRVAKTEDA